MSNELHPGAYRAGILIDGQEGTPYLAGTLTYEPSRGPLVEVPYVRDEPQFEVAQSWFRQKDSPRTLLFQDPDGTVTLTDLRWGGDRHSGVSVGRLDARLAIFERATRLLDEYHVRTVCSRIDGLHDFAGFESITSDHDRVDGRWRTVITVHPKDRIQVEYDGYTYTIRATTPGSTSGIEVIVRADAVIETTKESGATVDEHIAAQWPVRALLTLAFGIPLFWREHQLLDDQFPTWMLGGPPRQPMHVPLLFERTVRDHEQPEVDRRDLLLPMFTLTDLGPDGLRRWFELYDDPLFRRAVEPMVEMLNGGAGDFIEPRLTLTVFALEALGHYLDETRRPKAWLRDQIKRCLDVPGVDWSEVGTTEEIAQALAHVNNDLKHPDRNHRPDGVEMSLATSLGVVILRLKFAQLLGLDDSVMQRFCTMPAFRNTITSFERNGVSIRDGRLNRSPRG